MNDYHVLADILNKFHSAGGGIQLALIAASVAMLYGLIHLCKVLGLGILNRPKFSRSKGRLIYNIYQQKDGHLHIYHHDDTTDRLNSPTLAYLTQTPASPNTDTDTDTDTDTGAVPEPDTYKQLSAATTASPKASPTAG